MRAARGHRARIARALADLGVSAGQELVLGELWRGYDGVSQTALAERLSIEPPTVTKILRRYWHRNRLHRGNLELFRYAVREVAATLEPRAALRPPVAASANGG